jgi:transcription elongation factor Elf1
MNPQHTPTPITRYDLSRFSGWGKTPRNEDCDNCGRLIKQWEPVKINRRDGFVLCNECGEATQAIARAEGNQ